MIFINERSKKIHILRPTAANNQNLFVTFEFFDRLAEGLVLPRQECLAATEDILGDNGVRSQGSPDMMEVWNAKPKK